MSIKLLIPGTREPAAPYSVAVRGATSAKDTPAPDLLAPVHVLHAFSLSPMARDKAVQPQSVEAEDNDILELEIEGGFTLWTSVASYRDRLAELKPEALTNGAVLVDTVPGTSIEERGVRDWLSTALRVLRLEPDQISIEAVTRAGERIGAWAATKLLLHLIEKRLQPGPGLYALADGSLAPPLKPDQVRSVTDKDLPEGKPILVFIHGTASSTVGSFGALHAAEARPQWEELKRHFGEHIYAFEHRTLSESPIENAIQLAEKLPRGARLHLVSHSRGGLVGDLLCLTDVSSDQLKRYGREDPAVADADAQDKKDLKTLSDLLTDKRFEVVRFLRVASPARGTLLASENIDTFLSILTNLIGLIPGLVENPIYHVVKRVTLEVAKNRCRPEMIPGIEAMIPSSPLVALLNTVMRPVASNLGVIAGDIEGGGLFKRLGVFLTDNLLYDRRDNDLVVNTDSMFGGLRRLKSGHYVFDQGADVTHFNYFRNERTRLALVRWLTAPSNETPAEFRPIEVEGRPPVVMQRAAGAGAQPLVLLIPDVMGSKLSANGRAIWPEYLPLAEGKLTDIEIESADVQPVSLIDNYARLRDYLGNTYDVVPFAYDWRKSINAAAQQLAKEVAARLVATASILPGKTLPIRLLAHGAGGLVVRAMIAQSLKLWDQICERPGGRLVMLGTPNHGSHSIAETLLGVGVTIKQLALLDSVHDQQQILDVVARFPGLLELLPRNGGGWFTQKVWRDFRRASRDRAALPPADALRAARVVVDALPDAIPHADKVLYLAGCAPLTVCGAKVENGRLALEATTLGDGKITHASGRLPGVASWYVEAEHGELVNAEQSFPAIVELLETGTTRRLPTSAPGLARGGPTEFRYTPPPVLFPDARDFGAALIGQRLEPRGKKTRAPIKVSVFHGDLRYASYPVMVGHYIGDTIAGAEAHLDRRLGGTLSRRYQLGLYPGDLGSNTVALCEPTPAQKKLGLPRGAVVLGLGKMGELSAAVLAEAVRKGALEYLLQLTNAAAGEEPPYPAPIQKTPAEIGLTTLLIGCNSASSMAVEDCVGALVRGIARANQEIQQVFGGAARRAGSSGAQSIRIVELEILELFVDTAVQATYAIAGMAKTLSSELNANIQAEPVLRQGQGGRQRLNQIANRDYWRRVVVTQVTAASDGGNRRGALRFLAISDRARAEITVQDRQPELIERLIGSSIRDTRFNRDHAKTLFELLVPNELKDSLTQQSWLVLVVDAETANYPWELLVEGNEPLCARIGMVRQLETSSFRTQIRASTVKSAYVLGDPLTGQGVPPLPGAREEARLVADLLRRNDWNVNHNEERPPALDVLNRLFDRPYRILHFAGHGYFEQATTADEKGRSGMLLEDGVYLTAVEIAKMRQVPDLVFLNCCHLGEIGAEAPPSGSATAYNKLAASISRELIEMGVRAVVAAGWAVRDDAANVFARTFYEEMLLGRSFGRALREARKKIAEEFRDCNTWGAYQAYGDPDFKLDPQRDPEKPVDGPEFVAPQELIQELMFARRHARVALDTGGREADKEREETLKRIESMLAKCPPGWRNRGDVLAALGDAYGELLAFDNAVECYQRALATEDAGSISIKVAEQLANLEVRWGRKTNSPELIRRAIDRLDALLKLGETAERLSLLGSAWKRLAQLSVGSKVQEALQHSASYYKQATFHSNGIDPYPLLNWLVCEILLDRPPADIENWLARCEIAASWRYAQSRAFADASIPYDVAILRALLKGQLSEVEEEIARGYESARDEANASPREFGSVLDQLDFMIGMLENLGAARSRATGDPGSKTHRKPKAIQAKKVQKWRPGQN